MAKQGEALRLALAAQAEANRLKKKKKPAREITPEEARKAKIRKSIESRADRKALADELNWL